MVAQKLPTAFMVIYTMKQAILILVHKNVPQVCKLISYFQGQCEIFIHVDKSSSISKEDLSVLANMQGVKGVYRKYKIHWAGHSILKAELYLLQKALELGTSDYFHLLSGQDYPIRPLEDFLYFFSHTTSLGFVNCQHLPCPATDNNTYYRMQHFVLSDFINTKEPEGKQKVWKLVDWQKRHGIKRRIPDYVDHLYGGSAWFSIHKDVARFLVDYTKKKPAFFRRMNFTYIPEEIYVPSMILNSPYKDNIVSNNNCRTILWNYEAIDCSPKNILEVDFRRLLSNPFGYFARKFEIPESNAVLGSINQWLLKRSPLERLPNGGWNTVDLHSYLYDYGLSNGLIEFCREFRISSVCDFGCGPGWYVANLRRKSIAAVGYDINPNTIQMSDLMNGQIGLNCCGIADLTTEIKTVRRYELLLFLSVGPYIPKIFENTVIGNLKRNTSKYIVVSWASNEQGKLNNISQEHLINKICEDKIFIYNEVATNRLRKHCLLPLYQKTLLVFQKI